MEDPFTRRSTRPTMMTKDPYKDQEVVMSSELLRKLEEDRKQKLEDELKKKVVDIFYLLVKQLLNLFQKYINQKENAVHSVQ